MPQGSVINPSGSNAKTVIGQILHINGDIMPFINTANLKKYDPVIFDIKPYKVEYKDYIGYLPIAVLPEGFQDAKWNDALNERWEEEWSQFDTDTEIEKKLGKLNHSVKNHPNFKKPKQAK